MLNGQSEQGRREADRGQRATGEELGSERAIFPIEKGHAALCCFLGCQNQLFARVDPIHVKLLLSDMIKLLRDNFHPLGMLRGNVKDVSSNLPRYENNPQILRLCSSTGSQSCSSASALIALGLGFQVHWAKSKLSPPGI